MTGNLLRVLGETLTGQPDAADLPPSEAAIRPADPRPLDWGHVVDAAAARLDESWVQPDNTGHMLASGLAEELAATLCAYGMVAAEVGHMHVHEGALKVSRRTLPK